MEDASELLGAHLLAELVSALLVLCIHVDLAHRVLLPHVVELAGQVSELCAKVFIAFVVLKNCVEKRSQPKLVVLDFESELERLDFASEEDALVKAF